MTIKKAGKTAKGEWHGRIVFRARLDLELKVIEKMGYSSYFLIAA